MCNLSRCYRQVPYRLHSVLVHEGQAGSGHYWAYVFHPQRKVWLKVRRGTQTQQRGYTGLGVPFLSFVSV